MDCSVEVMKGLTLEKITGMEEEKTGTGESRVVFLTTCGREFLMWHQQDCCESVFICDVAGDPADLIGSPLLMSEEVSDPDYETSNTDLTEPYSSGSYTWTFYKFGTQKGYVTLRWLGTSSGYYSEEVSFEEVKPSR